MKANRPYILRNIFIDFCNHDKDIEVLIKYHIEHIRQAVFTQALECDINLNDCLRDLNYYVKDNILNYAEILKVFMISFKATISPKTTFKDYLVDFLSQEYYINNIMEAEE